MRIAVLTGAGISAESGIRTFRASNGLWEDHCIEDVASVEGFMRDPVLVHRFYNMRRADAARAQPNAAHRALAQLAQHHELTLITQNVDDLHERGGSDDVIHMHGSLLGALCAECGHRWPAPLAMRSLDLCPNCGKPQTRPDIVWFGEVPHHLERIFNAVEQAQLFAAIGTSGQVYPAAGLARHARRAGVRTIEMNMANTVIGRDFHEKRSGPASQVVPEWVAELCP